jgi:hypothetical protein
MEFKLSKFLKETVPAEEIDTISFKELMKITKATGFRPSESAKYGSRVHLMKGDERLFAIRLGKSVQLANDFTSLEGLKELIANHTVYYGQSENGTWVAFGKKGELSAGVTYTVEQLASVIGAA